MFGFNGSSGADGLGLSVQQRHRGQTNMSKFRHDCPDWDYMEIDEDDAEFGACTCDYGPEAHEIREAHLVRLDAYNEAEAKDIL